MTAHTTEPASIYGSIEPLLPHVTKPIQYVGGELNAVTTPWADAEVHWVLMYPDAYEVGQPNQGNAILYEVLNETGWISAERVFSVWPDMEALMRQHKVPLASLETHRPVRAFDVLLPKALKSVWPGCARNSWMRTPCCSSGTRQRM